jgi:hypothetical protein
MPQDKPKISFYADPDVHAWWESRQQGDGGRVLNELVRQHVLKSIIFSVRSTSKGWLGQAKFPNGSELHGSPKEGPTEAITEVSDLAIRMMKAGQIDGTGEWITSISSTTKCDTAAYMCQICVGPTTNAGFNDLFELGEPGKNCQRCQRPALYRIKSSVASN